MGKHTAPTRPSRAISMLGGSAAALATAASVAALQTIPVSSVEVYEAGPVDSADTALASDVSQSAGPLAIPTIGVVAPGFDRLVSLLGLPPATQSAEPADVQAGVWTEPTRPTPTPALPTGAGPTTPPTEEPDPTQEPDPTEEPTDPVPPADVVLAVGDSFAVADGATGSALYSITVVGVTVGYACTAAGATAAENGYFVAVELLVSTVADVAAGESGSAFDATDFVVPAADGTTTYPATTAAASCLTAAEQLPAGTLMAGQQYSGLVVLDVPTPSGSIVHRPDPTASGAVWTY